LFSAFHWLNLWTTTNQRRVILPRQFKVVWLRHWPISGQAVYTRTGLWSIIEALQLRPQSSLAERVAMSPP
jgi:hypothetical protein